VAEPLLRLALTASADTCEDARRCELEVLAHWYGDTPDLIEEAYGPYEDQSAFLSVERDDGAVVGASRLIVPGRLPLKTLSDMCAPPWSIDAVRSVRLAGVDPDRTFDVATLAVRPDNGAGPRVVASALYYGLINGALVNDHPWIIAIIDRHVRGLLAMVGLPLHALPGTRARSYMGSPACAPVFTYLPSLVAGQRLTDPEAHRFISMGQGLDGVLLPDPEDLLLPMSAGMDLRRPLTATAS
jgi:hypothetical protein